MNSTRLLDEITPLSPADRTLRYKEKELMTDSESTISAEVGTWILQPLNLEPNTMSDAGIFKAAKAAISANSIDDPDGDLESSEEDEEEAFIDEDDEDIEYDDGTPSDNGYDVGGNVPSIESSLKKIIAVASKMKNVEAELQKGSHDHLIKSISGGTKILFESDSFICFLIETYSIQKFLNKNTTSRLKQVEKKLYDFDLGNDVKETIFISGIFNFIYKDAICSFVTDADSLHTSITVSNKKVAIELEKEINEYIRSNNPIKNKLIYLIQARSGIAFEIKQTPKETFDSIILDEKIKEDIIDNTLGNLQLVDDNNGLIFYGDPGTGKSVSCRAVINLVIEHGYSCCYITTDFDFNSLNTFIQKYLAPCVIIFEDVDTIGKSRERVDNPNLSNFLQFLSGLTDTSDQVVFIATTNHIDKLDKALSNRPVRFNRLIGFEFPNNEQINQLVELKFAGDGITPELKKLCHNLKWTGAHIHELRRTCKLYSRKRDKTISEVFAESVDIVKQSFKMHIGKPDIGFNPKP